MDKKTILSKRGKDTFGYQNTEAVIEGIWELKKSIDKINTSIKNLQIKEGRYKGLFERMIRQNKLIIDLLKLGQGVVPEEECDEESKRLLDELA